MIKLPSELCMEVFARLEGSVPETEAVKLVEIIYARERAEETELARERNIVLHTIPQS